MSRGLGSMQRLLLHAVHAMLADPLMGFVFRSPRADCSHAPRLQYLTAYGTHLGACRCQIVPHAELIDRTAWQRRQAGEPLVDTVHAASATRAILRLAQIGALVRVWPVWTYTSARCPDCGRAEAFHPFHPRHCGRTVAVTVPELIHAVMTPEQAKCYEMVVSATTSHNT